MEKSWNLNDYKLYGFIQLYILLNKRLKFTKLIIFMQQLQYKYASIHIIIIIMHLISCTFVKNFSEGDTPGHLKWWYPELSITQVSSPSKYRGCLLEDSINIGQGKSWKSHGNWSLLQNGDLPYKCFYSILRPSNLVKPFESGVIRRSTVVSDIAWTLRRKPMPDR